MGVINAPDDYLRCAACGWSRQVTKEWIEEICRRYFQRDSDFVLHRSDLSRFICSKCGSKRIQLCDCYGRLIFCSEGKIEAGVKTEHPKKDIYPFLFQRQVGDGGDHLPQSLHNNYPKKLPRTGVCSACGEVGSNCRCDPSWSSFWHDWF